MHQAQAFWVTEAGVGALRAEPLPAPAASQVRVRTLYSGISRGTESLVFRGQVPPNQYHSMRAPFQTGEFSLPVKYGYSNVGIVEQGPAALCEQIVFCLYPHQNAYVVAADAVTPIPDGVPAERAILAANLETALNGLWDATPRLGDRIGVIGAGTVGCLVAYLAHRIPGCEVVLIDSDERKAALAKTLGLAFLTPAQLSGHPLFGKMDLVVEASGAVEALSVALDLAGFEATILVLSWFGNNSVTLALGEHFHSKRLQLISSQVGAIASAQRARWSHRRRLGKALDLLRDASLDCLINQQSRFSELPQTMARLAENPDGVLCHRVIY